MESAKVKQWYPGYMTGKLLVIVPEKGDPDWHEGKGFDVWIGRNGTPYWVMVRGEIETFDEAAARAREIASALYRINPEKVRMSQVDVEEQGFRPIK